MQENRRRRGASVFFGSEFGEDVLWCVLLGGMSEHAFLADAGETGDVDVDAAVHIAEAGCLEMAIELHLGIARR